MKTALAKGSNLKSKSIFMISMKKSLFFYGFRFIIPQLLSMEIVLEHVFRLRGIGMLLVDAVNFRDIGVTVAIIHSLSILMIFGNVLINLIRYFLDSGYRYSITKGYLNPNIS